MISNYFHTRLPFFETPSFGLQIELQNSRKISDKPYLNATANPNNWLPEFVFHRTWSASNLTVVRLFNITTNSTQFVIGLGSNAGMFWKEWQAIVGGQEKIVTMFTGMVIPQTLPCGLYQYQIEYADGRKYYSEYFEVHNFKFNQILIEGFTHFIYRSTCYFGEINYDLFRNFYHHLWLPAEALYPEINVTEETEEDLSGQVSNTSHRYDKTQLLSLPGVSEPTLDAINSMVMYTSGEKVECKVYSRNILNQLIPVLDVIPEKPDFTQNEVAPSLKFRVQIDPAISDAGCCDKASVVSYCDKAIPNPVVTRPTPTSIVVTINNTNASNWFDLGVLPRKSLVQILLINTLTSGTSVSASFESSEFGLGKATTVLAGIPYSVQIRIKAFGSDCWSEYSDPVII